MKTEYTEQNRTYITIRIHKHNNKNSLSNCHVESLNNPFLSQQSTRRHFPEDSIITFILSLSNLPLNIETSIIQPNYHPGVN